MNREDLSAAVTSPYLVVVKESIFAAMLLIVLWKISVIGPQVHTESRQAFEKTLNGQTAQFIEALKTIQDRSNERHMSYQKFVNDAVEEMKASKRENLRLIGALIRSGDLTPEEFSEAVRESTEPE